MQLEQLLMKNAITRNMADPMLAIAPVIPTDTLNTTEEYEVGPVEDSDCGGLAATPGDRYRSPYSHQQRDHQEIDSQ